MEILRRVKSGGETYSAWTGWCPADIKVMRPEWDDEKCQQFIDDYEDDIINAMVDAGWLVINEILGETTDYDIRE